MDTVYTIPPEFRDNIKSLSPTRRGPGFIVTGMGNVSALNVYNSLVDALINFFSAQNLYLSEPKNPERRRELRDCTEGPSGYPVYNLDEMPDMQITHVRDQETEDVKDEKVSAAEKPVMVVRIQSLEDAVRYQHGTRNRDWAEHVKEITTKKFMVYFNPAQKTKSEECGIETRDLFLQFAA